MIDRKNRDGRSAARIHDAEGLARRPSSHTIDIHAHIVVPQAAALAQPHLDPSKIPIARFVDTASKEINAQQTNNVREVMTTIDRRLSDLDRMGIDVQVVAPAPGQCYYSIDPKIAAATHRLADDGVAEYLRAQTGPVCRAWRSCAAGARDRSCKNSTVSWVI
jgi:aminocarboxymuconate-semialdehyde decarboxylase